MWIQRTMIVTLCNFKMLGRLISSTLPLVFAASSAEATFCHHLLGQEVTLDYADTGESTSEILNTVYLPINSDKSSFERALAAITPNPATIAIRGETLVMDWSSSRILPALRMQISDLERDFRNFGHVVSLRTSNTHRTFLSIEVEWASYQGGSSIRVGLFSGVN